MSVAKWTNSLNGHVILIPNQGIGIIQLRLKNHLRHYYLCQKSYLVLGVW